MHVVETPCRHGVAWEAMGSYVRYLAALQAGRPAGRPYEQGGHGWHMAYVAAWIGQAFGLIK